MTPTFLHRIIGGGEYESIRPVAGFGEGAAEDSKIQVLAATGASA